MPRRIETFACLVPGLGRSPSGSGTRTRVDYTRRGGVQHVLARGFESPRLHSTRPRCGWRRSGDSLMAGPVRSMAQRKRGRVECPERSRASEASRGGRGAVEGQALRVGRHKERSWPRVECPERSRASEASRGRVEGQSGTGPVRSMAQRKRGRVECPERSRASEASRGGRGGRGGRGARSCSTRISFVAAMVRCMPARPPTSTRGSRLTMRGRGQHGHVPGARWSSFTQSLSRAAPKRSHESDSGKDGRKPRSSR